jgi:hypothetical protein
MALGKVFAVDNYISTGKAIRRKRFILPEIEDPSEAVRKVKSPNIAGNNTPLADGLAGFGIPAR